jgi:para-aminobenzoate synthetase/4-amino-4-deoxychorismate lyase
MILLDDAQSTATNPTSRLYEIPLRQWRLMPTDNEAVDRIAVQDCLSELSQAASEGKYVVAAFSYEMGRCIHKLPQRNGPPSTHPLIEAWSFEDVRKLSKKQLDELITQELSKLGEFENIASILDVQESITEEQFCADIAKIQEYIRNGDTYQINHTYRIAGKTYGNPLALYGKLRERQPGRFGAYIEQDKHYNKRYILSQSPELFIERKGDILKAMPMKGTASALSNVANSLSDDPKNQAENVMIVDLLRNDLSRISLANTVTVPNLFEVARHGDVLQMTSTVQGRVKPGVALAKVIDAVFPCGSVTGAPKKRSMEIIQELEPSDRGYYCGALGWLDPNGDFAFSVPIRTAEIEENSVSQASTFTLGIGAGITIDSSAQQEWQECKIKSAFLMNLPSSTDLFETIAVKNAVPQRLEQHLNRMQASASALGIAFNRDKGAKIALDACAALDPELHFRLRLDLATNGTFSATTGPLDFLNEPVKIFWAKDILPADCTTHSGNALLHHKVSQRNLYDTAWQAAVKLGGFDALFTNEQGFVTEGGRTSVFIKPADSSEWLTPPASAGLLPGVMRASLLADPRMNAREANLTIKDVSMANEIILSNALRGTIKAHF